VLFGPGHELRMQDRFLMVEGIKVVNLERDMLWENGGATRRGKRGRICEEGVVAYTHGEITGRHSASILALACRL
jgi:hypothetical protein